MSPAAEAVLGLALYAAALVLIVAVVRRDRRHTAALNARRPAGKGGARGRRTDASAETNNRVKGG